MQMKLKFVIFLLVALSLDFTYGKKGGKGKGMRKKLEKLDKENKESKEKGHGKKDIEEKLEALEKRLDTLQKNNVHIHMDGDGHVDDIEDDQHIHMHMHLDCDDDHKHHHHKDNKEIYATCEVSPNEHYQGGDNVRGEIYFSQKGNSPVDVYVELSGFDTTGDDELTEHAIHIHEFGDLKNSCDSFGSHFNPDNHSHAAHNTSERHVGDIGNVPTDVHGEVDYHMTDDVISLHGKNSIIGRGVVIHHGKDDMAGEKIACCVVARADQSLHHYHVKDVETSDTDASEEEADDLVGGK